jgi:hypothetical protein
MYYYHYIGDGTLGLIIAKHVLYHLIHTPIQKEILNGLLGLDCLLSVPGTKVYFRSWLITSSPLVHNYFNSYCTQWNVNTLLGAAMDCWFPLPDLLLPSIWTLLVFSSPPELKATQFRTQDSRLWHIHRSLNEIIVLLSSTVFSSHCGLLYLK